MKATDTCYQGHNAEISFFTSWTLIADAFTMDMKITRKDECFFNPRVAFPANRCAERGLF